MNRRLGHGILLQVSILSLFAVGCHSGAASSAWVPCAQTVHLAGMAPAIAGMALVNPRGEAGEHRIEHLQPAADRSQSTGRAGLTGSNPGSLASSAANAQARSQRLASRTPARPRITLVVDIDETLCVTDYASVIWGIGRDSSRPLRDAPQALSRLSRQFDVLYLTARPKQCESRSRRWLLSRGFPDGRIVTSHSLRTFLSQGGFKKDMLAQLQSERDHILIGIGDKPEDAAAYRRNGMLPLVVNPWKSKRYHDNELIFQNWSSLEAFFSANRDLLTNPLQLTEAIRTKSRSFQFPG